MNNITRNSNKNRWSNSDLSSLTLWYNEGVPIDEIAKRLKKSPTSIANVISNKKGTLRNAPNPYQEFKSSNELIYHQVNYLENLVLIMSITKIGEKFFQANALMADVNLNKSTGLLKSEFTTEEACHRWFQAIPDLYSL